MHPEKSSIFLGTRGIPFPLSRGRGIVYVREASPLFDSLFYPSPSKERGEGINKEGLAPLLNSLYFGGFAPVAPEADKQSS